MKYPTRGKTPVCKEVPSNNNVAHVPGFIAFCMFFASFVFPNLVFSGEQFFDTLHLLKWVVALTPLGFLGVLAGYRLFRRGAPATNFRIDPFAAIWLALLLYITAQPLWTTIRSPETFYREWFFFVSMWLAYVLTALLLDKRMLRAILWGALLNAALSVVFAELQIRSLNAPFPFILPTPGNYIANTGQQNMFALWMAIAGLGGISLFSSIFSEQRTGRTLRDALLLVLLAVVFRGLIVSTSRSGILSLGTGFLLLSFFRLRLEGRKTLLKTACVFFLFALIAGVTVSQNERTAAALTEKLEDVVEKPLSIANRESIWATSWTMFTGQPWRGVGLGQFKWHYLENLNETLRRRPHTKWQYTHWAHNEFLQWMAEGGIVGAALMFSLWGIWGFCLLRAFVKKAPLSPEAVWGSALAALFMFNALWTRPFHRIENALWLALAFAATNREILPELPLLAKNGFKRGYRVLGGIICLTSLAGLLFMVDGVRGDRMLRMAKIVRDPGVAQELCEKAGKSLMVRDEAEKMLAYFFVQLGEKTQDAQLAARGLKALMNHFEKQPHVDELNFLQSWIPKLNDPRFTQYVASFIYRPAAVPQGESKQATESNESE